MEDITLGAARAAYWQVNGFGNDGGDSLPWVPLKIWKVTLKIPNTEGRRRAVKIHDLHHVVTGYGTSWTGESEIAAWELATNCLSSPAATVLNLGALSIGLVIAPRRTARAWSRGRMTRNLYREDGVDHLLPRTVAEMQTTLGLDRPGPGARLRDVPVMILAALPVMALMLVTVLAPVAGLAAIVNAMFYATR